jgi:hypothetical protein
MLVRIRDAAADGLNPAMGGWHEFGRDDHPAYAIAACVDYGPRGGDMNAYRRELLLQHPAWPALSFIPHLNRGKLAKLLGLILDPRWYVSLRMPKRGCDIVPYHDDAAKLHAYLGLDPRTMASVFGLCEPTDATSRCKLVLDTWAGDGMPTVCEYRYAGYFIWRRHQREAGMVKGALRASQLFIDYLRLIWLDAIYCDRVGRPAAPGKRPFQEGLFAPDHFFQQRAEAAAYLQYRDRFAAGG